MTPERLLAALLVVAVLLAAARLLMWQAKAPPEARAPGWRMAVLLGAQPICALLLYLTFAPPPVTIAAGTLVVATRGASSLPATAGSHVVALPEASLPAAVERVPDLGTALRRYPDVDRVLVIGEGLPARDREAARGRAIAFEPGPAPRGIVRLDPPMRAVPGASFTVGGGVAGHAGGTIELLDPAGRVVARQPLTAGGGFVLRGAARAAGVALFRLRVRDAGRKVVEEANVPLVVADAPPPRILLLAGAPGPEPKFLRRWAADAGLALHAQYPTGGGMAIGDAALPINATTLARFDLAVLDDRSWAALGAGERQAVVAAVRGGLGLLLRVTGPLPDTTRRQWQSLGFSIVGGGEVAQVRLAMGESALTRRAVRIAGRDLLPLVRDSGGAPIANWRAEGRGRIGLWPLTDSYVLAIGSTGGRHAEIWSQALSVLARAGGGAAPRIDGIARAGQRVVICGISGDGDLLLPGGGSARLLADKASSCTAFWPARAGWYQLATGQGWPLYVHVGDALPGARAADDRYQTLRLTAEGRTTGEREARTTPGTSWPWFLAWLIATAALWSFERAGRRRAAPKAEAES